MKVAVVLSALAFAQGVLSIALYGQCGGIEGVTGTCDSGLVCVVQNAYFFQCLTPSSGQTTTGGSGATTTKTTTTTKTSTTTIKTTTTTGGSVPTGITTTLPASSGYSALPTASVITGTFDGGMKRYGRISGSCQEQTETGEADAVFILQAGATIQNVIIGANQAEGIYCRGPCTVKNVWWADVCEDAITIKQTGAGDISYIIGGGAFHAEDKVVQHNGAGTVSIKNFYVNDFGKLYGSCGNCSTGYTRHVIIDNVAMINGTIGVSVNSNFGDTATITNVCTNGKPSATNVCCWYQGNTTGGEPIKAGCGPNGNICNYSLSSVKTC